MKTKFEKWLEKERKNLKKVRSIDTEVKDGEEVIGILSEDLQVLYTILVEYSEELTAKSEEKLESLLKTSPFEFFESLVNGRGEEKKKEIERMQLESLRHKQLHDLFWLEISEEFGFIDEDNLGIRKGYKLVRLQSHERVLRVMVMR